MSGNSLLVSVLFFLLQTCVYAQSKADLPEEATLNFSELAAIYGHTSEEYDVVTTDGYILKLFRIKGGSSVPIFMMHGTLDTADTYLLRGKSSIGIALADAGHDVWFGNMRGNRYSRKHTSLDPDSDKDFWDYSLHEIGIYDLPAMIDTILTTTGQSQVAAIGHSQGTTIFYVLASEKPEYNDKIKLMISLAPVCYLHNVKPMLSLIIPQWPTLSDLLGLLGINEILGSDSTSTEVIREICTNDLIGYEICAEGVMFPIAGLDSDELEDEFLNVIVGHYPAGTSKKDIDHLAQLSLRKKFANYDYGLVQNLVKYRSFSPPNYDLSNINMQVALIVGKSDKIADLDDVALLNSELSNVVLYHVMEREEFNHLDYIWGKNMADYMLPLIFDLLDKYVV